MENQEVDDLTNLEFKSFEESRRLDVELERLDFGVLTELFDVGDAYLEELANLKAQTKTREGTAVQKKRKKAGESLRERDPW